MAVDINKNRYRLIVLLYITFVCLSVLTIPSSLLHTNIYMIKTMEYQEKSIVSQIAFAESIIESQKTEYTSDSALNYLTIQKRIHSSIELLDFADKQIVDGLADQKTTVFNELTNKRKINLILLKDSLIFKLKEDLFDLADYIDKQPYRIDNSIRDLLPVQNFITVGSGKDIPWRKYLLLDKPAGISYMHLKRMKFLLLENERAYLIAVLRSLNLTPAYYSIKENKKLTSDPDKSKLINPVTKSTETVTVKNLSDSSIKGDERSKVKFDYLFRELVSSLRTDHLYVGVPTKIVENLTVSAKTNFELQLDPNASIAYTDNSISVLFDKPGNYKTSFYDLRNGSRILLFQKDLAVDMLPDPAIRLNIENANRNIINSKDLFRLNNLTATLPISGFGNIAVRVNGFRCTILQKNGGDPLSVYNYGAVFQNDMQRIIGKAKAGDIFLIDNLTVALGDGTTRTPLPLFYKIVD